MIGHYSQRLQQGLSPERSMANKGGGGGGTPYYENMNRLYGEQARAAGYMLDQSMPFIPQYMGNSNRMVQEAMDGSLQGRARNAAWADAAAAATASNNDALRQLTSYGALGDPSSGRFLDTVNQNAIKNTALRMGATNQANAWAEDQKWNRNAAAFGQATGMSSGAMSSLGSSAAGYGAAGNAMMANDAANAQGMGQFGGAMAKGLMAADGGYIEGKAVRMASGGDPWSKYKYSNPIGLTAPQKQKTSSQLGLMAAGAAPYLLGSGIKAGLKSEFFKDNVVEPVKDSLKSLVGKDYYSTAANTINQAKAGVEGSPEFAKALPEPDLSALQTPTDYSSAFGATDAPGLQSVAQGSTDVGYNLMSDAAKPASDFVVQDIGQSIVQAGAEEASKQAAEELAASAIGSAVLADGGYVKKPGLKLAMGGLAKSMRMPGVASLDASSQMKVSSQPAKIKMPSTAKGPGLAQQQAQSTMSPGDALRGGKTGYDMAKAAEKANQASNTAIDAADTTTNATEAAATASDTAQVAGTTADAAQAAGTTADATGAATDGAGPAGSIIKAGVDILSGRDAGTAVADAAASYAGAKGGAALGTAVAGPVGTVIGGVLGGVLGGSLFQDGGSVGPTLRQGRVDHTEGGEVEGPGTETSDDIPAWLSKGEYVLNKPAVDAIGRGKLDNLNQIGLKVRGGNLSLAKAKELANRGLKLEEVQHAKTKQRYK